MRITHLGHACLLLEMADQRVLIDPGNFADDLGTVNDLDAILVTHQHPDHLDPDDDNDLTPTGSSTWCEPIPMPACCAIR